VTIEEKIFSNYTADIDKMKRYGFTETNGRYEYSIDLPDDNMEIKVTYKDGEIYGNIYDLAFGEEYTNYRVKDPIGYTAGILENFNRVLLDVRNKCFINEVYGSDQARRILSYIKKHYGVRQEFLWDKYPTFGVFRVRGGPKWFALMGSVATCRFDPSSSSEKIADLINLRYESSRIKDMVKIKGIFPAYHMNKKNWISVKLDDSLSDSDIFDLIEISYNMISANR